MWDNSPQCLMFDSQNLTSQPWNVTIFSISWNNGGPRMKFWEQTVMLGGVL